MSVLGADKLIKQFSKLAKVGDPGDTEKALQQGLKLIQADAKLNCPVNHSELRTSIRTMTERTVSGATGSVYTNKAHGVYVELGTGPKGEENHEGISPNIDVAYSQKPWFVPVEEIDAADAAQYHFRKFAFGGKEFYKMEGQAAQPFLYPAMKNNEKLVNNVIGKFIAKKIKEAVKK